MGDSREADHQPQAADGLGQPDQNEPIGTFPHSIGMRWPFLVAFVLFGGIFMGVCVLVMVSQPQSRRPNPWIAVLPALVIVNFCVLVLSARRISLLRPNGECARGLDRVWKAIAPRLRPGALAYLLMSIAFPFVFILLLSQAPDGRFRTFLLTAFGFLTALLGSMLARNVFNLILLLSPARSSLTVAATQRGRWSIIRPIQYDIAVFAGVALFTIIAAHWRTPFARGAWIWLMVECVFRAWRISRRIVTIRRLAATSPHGSPTSIARHGATPNGRSEAESGPMVVYLPQVARQDVVRVIRRDFPDGDLKAVLGILDRFRTTAGPGQRDRVHLAILKLSSGDMQRLSELVEAAWTDFRRVIVSAESPRLWESGFSRGENLSSQERARLVEEDWHEYREWLNRR